MKCPDVNQNGYVCIMSIRRMFTNVARKYDLLNRMLTLGLDKRW